MAEKSPRPSAEEESDEDGEEAAEAQAIVLEDDDDEEVVEVLEEEEAAEAQAIVLEDDEEEEEAAVPDSPPGETPLPLEPPAVVPSPPSEVPAYPFYPTVSPVFYTPCPGQPAAPSVSGMNLFANDGSFMELFKKRMEASSAGAPEESKEPAESKPEPERRRPVSLVGKRRGGAKLALKTGIVSKKPKTDEEEILTHKGGAWAQYMAEVKKYKAHQCSDDDKTRPLVK